MALRAHAAVAAPQECCGALLARAGADSPPVRVEIAMPLRNVAARPEREFLIEAAQVRELERSASRNGWDVVGFYHSHPDGLTEPSLVDLQAAWPHYVHVIVTEGALAAWRLRGDRSGFDPVALLAAVDARLDAPRPAEEPLP